ncbi:ATP-binding protein [Paraburkholderia sp.]|uniref:ATP-binding protein n=1 Tax=Paraburkholderia sp. TaxID=1926495 RepID=UPI0023A787E7|nr:ATP-binding protein [Paraburkholderia sp.]MDE1182551.1 ATP-binding protein [Paraburkholderia sp.]
MNSTKSEDEKNLLASVRSARGTGSVVAATLKTDERVFARITDGIYREPASALRELIANAYDADATEVRIDTDAPRFSRIVVRDNGYGLTEEALVHVICHIGGSLKRTDKGSQFHVASDQDTSRSPNGRKLIGKLGIGLFSVSQLTHHLVIVTKVKGEDVRRICDILLVPQSDVPRPKSESGEDVYVTGKAQIKTIPADDLESHGTEITLLDIRGFVRESLQSQSLWAAISPELNDDTEEEFDDTDRNIDASTASPSKGETDALDLEEFYEKPPIPSFHIGRVSKRDSELLLELPSLPWLNDDSPSEKFKRLTAGVRNLAGETTERIRLNEVLDTYFRTLWTLSLSVPLPYVDKAPFDLQGQDGIPIFAISNKGVRARADRVELGANESISSKFGLTGDAPNSATPFSVIVDEIELKRPIQFSESGDAASAKLTAAPIMPNALMFVGRMKSDLASVSVEYSGGPLEFEAYFCWQPKIVPADHNGIMVRINGASGILFDDHFLKYQISELTRLRQLTAEVYVKRGLDAALNIDRESFNIAHTHYQVLKKWVHNALRQVMSRQKAVTGAANTVKLEGGLSAAVSELSAIVKQNEGPGTSRAEVSFSESPLLRATHSGLVFDRTTVFSPRKAKRPVTKSDKLKEELLEQQIKAVASLLQDYHVFDTLSDDERDELLRKIVAIFSVDIKK